MPADSYDLMTVWSIEPQRDPQPIADIPHCGWPERAATFTQLISVELLYVIAERESDQRIRWSQRNDGRYVVGLAGGRDPDCDHGVQLGAASIVADDNARLAAGRAAPVDEVDLAAEWRASFPDEAEHDEADFGRRLTMPVYLLWGAHNFLQTLDPIKIWADYADRVTGSVIEDCGHFLPEERPQEVLTALQSFLAQNPS